MHSSLFNILNSFVTDFLDFRGHGFNEVKIKNCINNSSFSFPLFPLTEGYSTAHSSHNRGCSKLQFWIGIQVLSRVKVFDEIGMRKIQNDLVD